MPGPALPSVDYERFANPPLRAMLGQVQFPPILRLQKGVEAVADFQEAIRDSFPGFGVEQQIQITVSPAGDAETTTNRSAAFRFTNEDETWSALVAPTALTLEAAAGGRYSSYSSFADLFRTVWGAAVEDLRPGKISQQGLRYVDHIEGDRSANEWAEWINPDLLGGMAGEVLGTGLERAVCELLYPQDGGRLVFRHGIVEAGPQNAKGYLLDFDSIHTEPVPAGDVDTLIARFDDSHEILYRFFRWCVTDRALEEFRDAGS
jgi:uncharacterized protein (TIGR04255 family)